MNRRRFNDGNRRKVLVQFGATSSEFSLWAGFATKLKEALNKSEGVLSLARGAWR